MVHTRGITSRLWSVRIQWNAARSVCYCPGHFVVIAPSRFTSECHTDLAVGNLNRSRRNRRHSGVIIKDSGMIIMKRYKVCMGLGIRKIDTWIMKTKRTKIAICWTLISDMCNTCSRLTQVTLSLPLKIQHFYR